MTPVSDLLGRRLRNQKLTSADRATPAELVAWLGAVQAQDYPAAKWALGLRAKGLGDADIEQALDGRLHWSARSAAPHASRRTSQVYLLPNYDEYLIAYKDRPAADAGRAANVEARSNGAFPHHVIIDGRVAGSCGEP